MPDTTIPAEYANTAVGRDIRVVIGEAVAVFLQAARYCPEDDRVVLELVTPLLQIIIVAVDPGHLIELVIDTEAAL